MDKKNVKIFIICGKARAGKDTTVGFMENEFNKQNKKFVTLQFSFYFKEYTKKITGWDGSEETKPRSFLQQLGTDLIRKQIDEKFFIKRMIQDIDVYSYFVDNIIISDARLPEEIEDIKKRFDNVISIEIQRPNFVNELSSSEKKHITEIGLDNYKSYDYKIINDGSLKDLENKVESFINEVK